MLRLRVLRILLPLLLGLLVLVVWLSWEPRSEVHRRQPVEPSLAATGEPRAEGLSFKEFSEGSDSRLAGHADLFEPHEDGSLRLEGIRELEIQRDGRGPLLVSADRGQREGTEGDHRWRFDERVVFHDPEQDLRLFLPSLDIDDAAGEARSSGEIRLEAPHLSGQATSVVYGLHGQPGRIGEPLLEDRFGGRVRADGAVLLDGIRDVELVGHAQVEQPGKRLDGERLRLIRGPGGRLRQAVADGDVSGSWASDDRGPIELSGNRLEGRWSETGQVEFVGLDGEALLHGPEEMLSAGTIEIARANGDSADWTMKADGEVYARGAFGGAPGSLRAEQLQATFDANFVLRQADARGRVTYEGRETRAEAERGTFLSEPDTAGTIELFGNDLRKARLSQGKTRVAAKTIRTDVRGNRLEAQELVEATLLPGGDETGDAQGARLFTAERAIHFVSDGLSSAHAGTQLTFTGNVRGWQGERNLAGGIVVVNQEARTIRAEQAVSTRIPREAASVATSEDDFIQIGADSLDYAEAAALAVYEGHVRVRMLEGWMEAKRVEVELADDSRKIREIRAAGSVRIEFQRSTDEEMTHPVSGTADRLVYLPAESVVRLFGDETPAVVRRLGEGGGTTTGRVLRYRVDSGTLDVDSGEQGPGRIRG